jgi:predicted HTH domain antitoxin
MPRTLRFEWEGPDEVFDDRFREEEFLTQLKQEAVLKLFTAGRLSSGYAASLLGMTRRDFFSLLQQQGLPLVQYTDEDLMQDLEALRLFESQRRERQT